MESRPGNFPDDATLLARCSRLGPPQALSSEPPVSPCQARQGDCWRPEALRPLSADHDMTGHGLRSLAAHASWACALKWFTVQ